MSEPSAAPETSERSSSPVPDCITFTVKANNDTKYSLSLPETTSIADVKAKLAELSEVPAERQRLIYSGRVMKNEETLFTYKVKSGNTVHMVKSAASNTATSSGGTAGGVPAASGVPRNLAAGTGNNPLAGLTGARYAGHVQLPSADMFGPDGGMGPPPDPETIAQAMSNPMIQAQMNEMLQNPQLLDYIINSNPMLRAMGPSARELMQSDMFRQMLTDPANIRNMARMNADAGMGSGSRPGGFPAPGAVDNAGAPADQQPASQQPAAQQPANPFASLFGGPGAGAPPPLSNLFGLQGFPGAPAPSTAGQAGTLPPGGAAGQQQQLPPFSNPFMLNPAAMEQMMQMMGGGGANPPGSTAGVGSPPPNPFAGLFGGMPPAVAIPADNTPPEERYADQLRQLNDMGFFDFDRNVEALRRSGGSVQGAINQLLGG